MRAKPEPGRDLYRDIATGERAAEEAWVESARRHDARLREENRLAWASYHRDQAERLSGILASLIAHHEEQVEKYQDHECKGAA